MWASLRTATSAPSMPSGLQSCPRTCSLLAASVENAIRFSGGRVLERVGRREMRGEGVRRVQC